ncbi:hypothetical protein GALMADRAFT_773766 [Galerina marginata CBS 339.88]|uniref:Uncharacterized protein n=1 Tax=Galerina marginata (strain CBS 339.88) TaxID=685588 RepID=A0A067SPT0_GALM3|nr:hypothetical protein GALMADRAFT_773766 [Galerina marginata CBS 339.88]
MLDESRPHHSFSGDARSLKAAGVSSNHQFLIMVNFGVLTDIIGVLFVVKNSTQGQGISDGSSLLFTRVSTFMPVLYIFLRSLVSFVGLGVAVCVANADCTGRPVAISIITHICDAPTFDLNCIS